MRGPETRLRKKIIERLIQEFPGIYVRKIHGNAFQNVGIPDLLGCLCGMFFGLEIKSPGKKATAAQLLEGGKIKKSKGVFAVVTSPDEALDALTPIWIGKNK